MGSLNFEADDEEIAAKRRAEVVAWLNSLFPELKLPEEATEWELRVQLFDGSVLNGILRMLNTGAVDEIRYSDYVPSERRPEILKLFLSVVNNLGLPTFQAADLEKGNFSAVLECLLAIRSHIDSTVRKDKRISPTQSLLSVANEILDESIEKKNGELPQRVACLLKKVLQEIERRVTTQTEHIKDQSA